MPFRRPRRAKPANAANRTSIDLVETRARDGPETGGLLPFKGRPGRAGLRPFHPFHDRVAEGGSRPFATSGDVRFSAAVGG